MLVSNAGVSLTGEVADLDPADMEWIVGINFWGVVNGTQAFLPHLIASGRGHVVTMSSLFGLLSIPGQSMYNATKYAVRGFSESLREELLGRHPVGVTVVHPGGIKTAIARNPGCPRARTTRPSPGCSTSSWPRWRPSGRPRSSCAACCAGSRGCSSGWTRTCCTSSPASSAPRYQDVVASRANRMRP